VKMNLRPLIIGLFATMAFQCAEASRYFIRFTDKNNSLYSVSNPSAFLSAEAIQRRSNANIPVTIDDIPVNMSYIDSIRATGAVILNVSKWLNGISIECDSLVYDQIRTFPFVESIRSIKQIPSKAPKDAKKDPANIPPFRNPVMLRVQNLDYGNSFNQINMINGDYLHDLGFTGEGIPIAVLDAGFYNVDQLEAFDSIRLNNRILGTWDFVNDESSVYEDNSHGMQVLSCIAGNLPGQLVGTAPSASFWLLRTEDASTEYLIEEYNWVSGAEYADSAGARIITSSLGYSTFDDSTMDHSYTDMDGNTTPASIGADMAAARGMLVLASAGNLGNSPWHYISAPSDADSVLAVGAVNELGYKAGFSSWGPSYDGDVKPNVAAQGQQTTVASIGGGISSANGTSFACPVLAGAAACLWQAHPGKSNMEVFHAIQQSASYYQNPGDSLGYGIPDFRVAHLLLGGLELDLPSGDNLLGVFPNPFSDRLEIRFYAERSRKMEVELLDGLGRLVTARTEVLQKGFVNTVNLDTAGALRKGLYFLHIRTEENTWLRKVIHY